MEGRCWRRRWRRRRPGSRRAASTTISAVAGVSLHQTGTVAASFTASVTTEQSPSSFPMLDPMSRRSMWGQEKLSSSPSTPASWQSRASRCQFCSSLSLPEPAMIDAMRTRSGNASLMRRMPGQPPVERLVGDQLPVPGRVQRRARPLLHGDERVLGRRAHELGLGADHVDDGVEPDGLGHHPAPSRLEGAKDVALRLRRRRGGEQEGILETESR